MPLIMYIGVNQKKEGIVEIGWLIGAIKGDNRVFREYFGKSSAYELPF
jgi:hypothetical protein